jgi:hypothetical protein
LEILQNVSYFRTFLNDVISNFPPLSQQGSKKNAKKGKFSNKLRKTSFRKCAKSFQRSNFELPATFAAALADALQLKTLLVFAQEELVSLSEKNAKFEQKVPTSYLLYDKKILFSYCLKYIVIQLRENFLILHYSTTKNNGFMATLTLFCKQRTWFSFGFLLICAGEGKNIYLHFEKHTFHKLIEEIVGKTLKLHWIYHLNLSLIFWKY